jgi:hypothetical protein
MPVAGDAGPSWSAAWRLGAPGSGSSANGPPPTCLWLDAVRSCSYRWRTPSVDIISVQPLVAARTADVTPRVFVGEPLAVNIGRGVAAESGGLSKKGTSGEYSVEHVHLLPYILSILMGSAVCSAASQECVLIRTFTQTPAGAWASGSSRTLVSTLYNCTAATTGPAKLPAG